MIRRTLMVVCALLLWGAAGWAQESQGPDVFVPISELPPGQQLPAAPFLIVAYAFIWVAVLVYVTLLWRRLAAVQKDLEALRRRSQ